jgi:MFS family permease
LIPAGRTLQLLLLALAVAAGTYGRAAVGPLQETLQMSLGLSDNQIALLQGAALALPSGMAAIPLGILVDRFLRVRLLLIFTAAAIAGSFLTALASGFAVLFAARCLIGLALAGTGPAALSLVADLYPPAQRGRAAMALTVIAVAGTSAAFAFGGALLAAYASDPDAWRRAMLWSTVPLVPVLFMMLALREPLRIGREIDKYSVRKAGGELWRYRAVIAPLIVGFVMVGVGDVAALVWAAPTLSRSFNLSPAYVGGIMAMVLMVSGVVGPITGGLVADLCQRSAGPRRTMTVLGALAFLSIMTVGNAISVMTTTLALVVVPNELRGLCIGLFTASGAILGVALAPLTVSLLSGAIGGPTMIGHALAVVGATTAALGTATFAFGRRYLPRSKA